LNQLEDWGWDRIHADAFHALLAHDPSLSDPAGPEPSARGPFPHPLLPARVVEEQRDGYTVVSAAGVLRARVAGRLRHHAPGKDALPAVGDWVAIAGGTGAATSLPAATVIHAVLPRRTVLVRKEAGTTSTAQVIAANVDVALLVTSLNADLEPRRLERYLAVIWDSGAQPVLVLNKVDLCADPEVVLAAIGPVALGVPVVVLSALEGRGLEALDEHLRPARTALLVGSSGVGKSTLVNRLAGAREQHVNVIRARDERGQHTTTARRLLRLPSGALLVDTPGMRELALWDADEGLDEAFEDVTGLFSQCRFNDCGHAGEPGCAVGDAIAAGRLDPERFAAWRKLQRELAHLQAKASKRVGRERKRAYRDATKSHRTRTQALKRRRGLDR